MHQFLFKLLLVFLPMQLGYHMWPEWTMVLGRRIDYLSPTIYGTDVLIVLILVSWIVSHYKKTPKLISFAQKNGAKHRYTVLLTFIVLAFAGINILYAVSQMSALYFWIKVLEYTLLGLYIIQTRPKVSSVIPLLSIGVFYSSLIAIAQFILQRSIGGPLWFFGERTFSNITPGIAQYNFCVPFTSTCTLLLRAYGTFPHPNVLGGFLALTLPLVLNQFMSSGRLSKKIKSLYILFGVIGIIALILTFSRSAWVAAIIGIVYVLVRKRFSIFLIAISAVIVLFIATTIGLQDESVVIRQALNWSAISMFMDSPVIGKGLGNFLVELPEYLVTRQIYFLQPVHNIYLLALAETGVVGCALVLLILWKALRYTSQKYTLFRYTFITLLLLGFVDHYPASLQQGQLLFTLLLSLSLIR